MKRHTALIATTLLLALATSCNTDRKEIENNALGYLNATGNYLIDEAMPYANKETKETTLTFLRDNLIPNTPKSYIESNTPATIVIDGIAVENDTAYVAYTKTTPIKTLQNEIRLVKEDGKWLVYVPLVLPETITMRGDTTMVQVPASTTLPALKMNTSAQ
ncbi:MAG: hypothetical protein IJ785_07285 [Bacteroidales bacterium]|nr:hypothetical protein [Bacteroidales bacterium]